MVMHPVPLAVMTAIVVAGLLLVVPAALRLRRALDARTLWLHSASAVFIALAAVPPAALGVLWYARTVDYVWAIQGPFPFNRLGSGPFQLAMLAGGTLATAVCLGAAIWLKVLAHPRPPA